MSGVSNEQRLAGASQGWTITFASTLPVMAVVALAPALPGMLEFFRTNAEAELLTPLIVTAPALTAALFSPFAGWVADRFGRRWPMTLGIFLFAILGMLPVILSDLYLIIATRLCAGIAMAFVLVTTGALLADYFDESRRRTWLTAQGVAQPLAGALVLTASGFLAQRDWHDAFLIYGLMLPVAAAAFLFCYEPQRFQQGEETAQSKTPFPWPKALQVCITAGVTGVAFFAFIIFSGLAFAQVGISDESQLGAIVGAISLMTVTGAFAFNILSRRVAPEWIFVIQLVMMGAALIIVGLSPNLPTMIAGGVVHQIGAGMLVVTTVFWLSRVMPPEHRGRGFGLFNTVLFIGQFLTPVVVTTLGGALGSLLWGLVGLGGLSVASAAVVALLHVGGRRRAAQPA